MYYKERTEFGTLSISSEPTVDDDPLDELCRSAEIDRREPVRPAASHARWDERYQYINIHGNPHLRLTVGIILQGGSQSLSPISLETASIPSRCRSESYAENMA